MHQAQWSPERPLPPPVSLASQSHHEKPPEVTGDMGSIPGWGGTSPGEGSDYPSQYSCLENPMDRGAWQITAHGVVKEVDMT